MTVLHRCSDVRQPVGQRLPGQRGAVCDEGIQRLGGAAVAHLAAALHKPTWLLLPHNADFRWLHQRSDSTWYPTMRLFRQPCRGNWADVVDQVKEAFDDLFILDIDALAAAKLH